jgi:monoamine oxidase
MAEGLAGSITTSSELVAVRAAAGGTHELSFQQGSATRQVSADHVVLALPFSILRRSVDSSRAGCSALKRTAIAELGMGTNSKLHVQFTDRHWEQLGANGDSYADTGYQSNWDVSRAQAGASGILVDYTGGTIGANVGDRASSATRRFLDQVEPVLPGIGAKHNGRATVDFWPAHRWTRGSYSYWKPGQYTRFAGVERERSGTCHFAGEHTSVDFQGFLNGAVESGERAAREVIDDLG